MYNYGDIPNSIFTKKYIPIAKHIWTIHKNLGFNIVEKVIQSSKEFMYPEIKERLDVTIKTASAIINNEVEMPEKSVTYMLFPPISTIRSDLSQGTNRLIYGESADVTFVVINDLDNEVFFLLNGHLEDGIPVDWWLAGPDDPLLERRHLKLGIKVRQLPQKVRNLTDCGTRMIDILKDVRNERSPQWATSSYGTSMVYGMAMANLLVERSSWEAYAAIWDGINTKNFGLPDYFFCYIPWPPLIQTLARLDRSGFTTRLCGLATGHLLYIQGLENTAISWFKTNFPEIWQIAILDQLKTGIPTPDQTLGCRLPNLRDEKSYKTSNFEWKYPNPASFLKLSDVGISSEDALKGILTNITHETKGPYTSSNVLSIGMGLNTEIKEKRNS